MQKEVKRTLIIAAGVTCILLGLIGLVLPFLQGVLFIVIGVILLSIYSPMVRKGMEAHTERYPKLKSIVKKLEAWIERVVGRP